MISDCFAKKTTAASAPKIVWAAKVYKTAHIQPQSLKIVAS